MATARPSRQVRLATIEAELRKLDRLDREVAALKQQVRTLERAVAAANEQTADVRALATAVARSRGLVIA
jgi:hypothetical protein